MSLLNKLKVGDYLRFDKTVYKFLGAYEFSGPSNICYTLKIIYADDSELIGEEFNVRSINIFEHLPDLPDEIKAKLL